MPHSKHDEKKPEQNPQPETKSFHSDHKDRIKKAVEAFTEKHRPKAGPSRHNASPEKDLEKIILEWMRKNGFHVNVVESKATFSHTQQRFISNSVKSGFADIVGNHNSGIAVFVELKAPGRRSTLRENQREFLLSKIETGCFAVCVDSVEMLCAQWDEFLTHKRRNQHLLAVDFLKVALPAKKAIKDNEPLLPEE
jgi:hypothetical protein